MDNKSYKKLIVVFLGVLILLSPIFIYIYHFWGAALSVSSSVWADFGTYLSGVYTPIAALVAAGITYYVGILAEKRNNTNLKISQQQSRPLLHLSIHDGEERIELTFVNKGKGVLIIDRFYLVDLNNDHFEAIYDILPDIDLRYENYTMPLNGRMISPGEEKNLLLFTRKTAQEYFEGSDIDFKNNYEACKESLRKKLATLTLVCSYKDLFENQMPQYSQSLEWYGRHFKE